MSIESEKQPHGKKLWLLVFGALGIVYGDIGTSPLYAINEIFFGHGLPHYSRMEIFGAISLVFWALTLVIAVKYVFLVLRVDNEGEGGVFALYNLVTSVSKHPRLLAGLLLFGAGLLYGDGMITPAISVISAVEGLRNITSSFTPYIVPVTIVILTGLFVIQRYGTFRVGAVFGPVMTVWFFVIGTIGIWSMFMNPQILRAANPYYAWIFLTTHSLRTVFLTLGSVMLVITGGEAMFADMGHFGRFPIRLGWYVMVYPALLFNYFGQGAYLLSGKTIVYQNIFYSMVPHWAVVPMVILATLATVIASQAMISGAFSLTKQAISLRLLPFIPIRYTNKDHEGQIYIPFINIVLYIGAVSLVLFFGSSTRLAGAYGLAVAGDMCITTFAMIYISRSLWKWKWLAVCGVFLPFFILDGSFVLANSLKFIEGGYIPFSIGLIVFGTIQIWTWGRRHILKAFNAYPVMTVRELIKLQESSAVDLPRTVIFLTRYAIHTLDDNVPIQMQLYWERHGMMPKHLVFLTVELLKEPHARKRIHVDQLSLDTKDRGSVTNITVQYGFMEDIDIEPLIKRFIEHKDIPSSDPIDQWIFHVLYEKVRLKKDATRLERIKFKVYSFIHRNTDTADHYFGLGQNHPLSIDILPVRLL